MSTAYVFDPLYLEHDAPHHPENRRRLEHVLDHLRQTDMLQRLVALPARDATVDELAFIHDREYIARVEATSASSGVWFDADTYATPRSYATAVRAAGGMLNATEAVLAGQVDNAFALVRPPGHHALANRAMGFCLFNNVAIAAAFALGRVARVMIVDIDLHHGNGTQDSFYEDPRVLYVSMHQSPFYPGTGHWRETGRGAGVGFTVNVPLGAGTGDAGYDRVMAEIVTPTARRFRPELILVSAGYDAHWLDPIGSMLLSVSGYAAMTRRLVTLADELCAGRIVLGLEGGYDLQALAACVAATFAVLLGDEHIADPLGGAPRTERPVDVVIDAVQQAHSLLPGAYARGKMQPSL